MPPYAPRYRASKRRRRVGRKFRGRKRTRRGRGGQRSVQRYSNLVRLIKKVAIRSAESKFNYLYGSQLTALAGQGYLMNPWMGITEGTSQEQRVGNEVYVKGMLLKGNITCSANYPIDDRTVRISLIWCPDNLVDHTHVSAFVRYDNIVDNEGNLYIDNWYQYGVLPNSIGYANASFDKDSGIAVLYQKRIKLRQSHNTWRSDTNLAGVSLHPIRCWVPMKLRKFKFVGDGGNDVYRGSKGQYYWLFDVTDTFGTVASTPMLAFDWISKVYFKDP
ncbi:putative capsid protein [Lake Sarah-associated circular virus-51]|uniref:putative capsid protein n=1 Tax=Lake Sarah-associated circular virus-51 TaxID=1685781 RepID=UPI000777B455|nr:putative capsid protein [Lake Sarah-associated circular virus-51]ALE29837.1 putative capsid protein [Lake Sarah-associated circular virus-51]